MFKRCTYILVFSNLVHEYVCPISIFEYTGNNFQSVISVLMRLFVSISSEINFKAFFQKLPLKAMTWS